MEQPIWVRNSKFIGHLIVASLIVMAVISVSALPLTILSAWYHWWTILLAYGAYALEVAILYWWYRALARKRNFAVPALTSKMSWRTVRLILVTVALLFLVALANRWLMAWGHVPTVENQRVLNQMWMAHPGAMAVGICVFGPACEELIFRGIFASYVGFKPYQQTGYIVVTWLVSSFLFGLAHTDPTSPLQYGYYVIMGAVIGGVYWLSGRDIRANTVVHMLANTLMMLMLISGF